MCRDDSAEVIFDFFFLCLLKNSILGTQLPPKKGKFSLRPFSSKNKI